MADVTTNISKVNETGDKIMTPSCSYVNLTAGTTIIKAASGRLIGAIINSHSSGTVKIYDMAVDESPNSPVICNTITLAAGERSIDFRGLKFGTGCLVKVGGTADITFLFN